MALDLQLMTEHVQAGFFHFVLWPLVEKWDLDLETARWSECSGFFQERRCAGWEGLLEAFVDCEQVPSRNFHALVNEQSPPSERRCAGCDGALGGFRGL